MTFSFRSVAHFVAIVVLMFFSEIFSFSAFASTNSGIDTPTGVTTLPLGVQGVEGMDLVAQPGGSVYVGVGTNVPQAPLDVSGGMRAGGSTVVAGDACSPEGMFGYDSSSATHSPVYCSSSLHWTAISGGIPVNRTWHAITCGSSGTNNLSYPIDIMVIYNIDSYVTVDGIVFGATATSVACHPVTATVPPGQTWAASGTGSTAGCAGCYSLY